MTHAGPYGSYKKLKCPLIQGTENCNKHILSTMTRTRRSSSGSGNLPKYFAKHGIPYEDPNKIKKSGQGRFNWGTGFDDIDEAKNAGEFNFGRTRRRSNSTSEKEGPRNLSVASISSEDVFIEE